MDAESASRVQQNEIPNNRRACHSQSDQSSLYLNMPVVRPPQNRRPGSFSRRDDVVWHSAPSSHSSTPSTLSRPASANIDELGMLCRHAGTHLDTPSAHLGSGSDYEVHQRHSRFLADSSDAVTIYAEPGAVDALADETTPTQAAHAGASLGSTSGVSGASGPPAMREALLELLESGRPEVVYAIQQYEIAMREQGQWRMDGEHQ